MLKVEWIVKESRMFVIKAVCFFINSMVVFFSGMVPQTLVCILLPLKGDHFTFPCVPCVLSEDYSYAFTLVEDQ